MCFGVHFRVNFWFIFLFSHNYLFFSLVSQWSLWVFCPFSLLSKIFFPSLTLFCSLSVLYGLTSLTPSIWLFCFVCLVLLHDMLCCYCYICGLTSLLEALRFQRTSLPCTPRLFSLPVQRISTQYQPDLFGLLSFTSRMPFHPMGRLWFGPPLCRTSWVRPSALWARLWVHQAVVWKSLWGKNLMHCSLGLSSCARICLSLITSHRKDRNCFLCNSSLVDRIHAYWPGAYLVSFIDPWIILGRAMCTASAKAYLFNSSSAY